MAGAHRPLIDPLMRFPLSLLSLLSLSLALSVCFLFWWHPDLVLCITLTEVRVPKHTIRGHAVKLECHYDMEGEALYSVKWYKDGREFYRYVPRDDPPGTVFPQLGIAVDVSQTTTPSPPKPVHSIPGPSSLTSFIFSVCALSLLRPLLYSIALVLLTTWLLLAM